jgi:hypothetical protein
VNPQVLPLLLASCSRGWMRTRDCPRESASKSLTCGDAVEPVTRIELACPPGNLMQYPLWVRLVLVGMALWDPNRPFRAVLSRPFVVRG